MRTCHQFIAVIHATCTDQLVSDQILYQFYNDHDSNLGRQFCFAKVDLTTEQIVRESVGPYKADIVRDDTLAGIWKKAMTIVDEQHGDLGLAESIEIVREDLYLNRFLHKPCTNKTFKDLPNG